MNLEQKHEYPWSLWNQILTDFSVRFWPKNFSFHQSDLTLVWSMHKYPWYGTRGCKWHSPVNTGPSKMVYYILHITNFSHQYPSSPSSLTEGIFGHLRAFNCCMVQHLYSYWMKLNRNKRQNSTIAYKLIHLIGVAFSDTF